MPTTAINNNNNANTATINNNSNSNDTMNTSRSIKINFQGASREVDLPTPATLAGLQAAVASAFGVEFAARSEAGDAESDLSFTYMDNDGDDIVFDKDSELSLALRLCPSPLEICAASKQKDKKEDDEDDAKPDEKKRIYRRASRNLREYHGVPSMTPPKLIRTLAFLKLHPRRLVKQGLAPAQLLAGIKAPQPLGNSDNNDDLAEAVVSDMELMSVEDDRKEWNDGFVSVGDGEKPTDAPDKDAVAAGHSSSEEDGEEEGDGAGAGAGADKKQNEQRKPKNVMHAAFLTAGIKLRPREVMPLFLALGVHPRRLAKLGRVDGKELKADMESVKRRHRHHGGGHPGMAHRHPGMAHHGMALPGMAHFYARGAPGGPVGCAPGGASSRRSGDDSGGPGGKACGPGRRFGSCSPVQGMFFCQPPPPPPHADSKRGSGGAGGPPCGPHHHGQPGHPGRFGGGGGGGGAGAGGCPFSPEMMVWMGGRSTCRAGGGGRGGGGCCSRGGAGSGGGGNGGHWYGYSG